MIPEIFSYINLSFQINVNGQYIWRQKLENPDHVYLCSFQDYSWLLLMTWKFHWLKNPGIFCRTFFSVDICNRGSRCHQAKCTTALRVKTRQDRGRWVLLYPCWLRYNTTQLLTWTHLAALPVRLQPPWGQTALFCAGNIYRTFYSWSNPKINLFPKWLRDLQEGQRPGSQARTAWWRSHVAEPAPRPGDTLFSKVHHNLKFLIFPFRGPSTAHSLCAPSEVENTSVTLISKAKDCQKQS